MYAHLGSCLQNKCVVISTIALVEKSIFLKVVTAKISRKKSTMSELRIKRFWRPKLSATWIFFLLKCIRPCYRPHVEIWRRRVVSFMQMHLPFRYSFWRKREPTRKGDARQKSPSSWLPMRVFFHTALRTQTAFATYDDWCGHTEPRLISVACASSCTFTLVPLLSFLDLQDDSFLWLWRFLSPVYPPWEMVSASSHHLKRS